MFTPLKRNAKLDLFIASSTVRGMGSNLHCIFHQSPFHMRSTRLVMTRRVSTAAMQNLSTTIDSELLNPPQIGMMRRALTFACQVPSYKLRHGGVYVLAVREGVFPFSCQVKMAPAMEMVAVVNNRLIALYRV